MSLSDFKVTAVIPVRDLESASQFYENVLGLRRAEAQTADPDGITYQCGGDTTMQLHKSDVGVASGTTLVSWAVDDIHSEIEWFQNESGIEFLNTSTEEGVVNPVLTSPDGEKAAWFQDPDGNWLCLHQKP